MAVATNRGLTTHREEDSSQGCDDQSASSEASSYTSMYPSVGVDHLQNRSQHRSMNCLALVDSSDIHYGPISREMAEELCREHGEYLLRTSSGSSENELRLTVRRTCARYDCAHFKIYKENQPQIPGGRHIYFMSDCTRRMMFTKLLDLLEHFIKEGIEQSMLLKPCSKRSNRILHSHKISKSHPVNPNPISSKTYFSGHYGSEKVVLVEKKNKMNVIIEGRLRLHLQHPNVLRMIGVSVLDPVCLVLPDEAQYLLHDYIKKLKSSKTKQMAKVCHDVCCGMIYLHSVNCLHRSLQSRACIVDKEGVVKISDFDKSSFAESHIADPAPLLVPTRWAAPEVLKEGIVSKSSDVWSFGVLVWEVFNKGQMPYHHLQSSQLTAELKPGFRLSLSKKHAKHDVVLERCFRYNSRNRPTFDFLETVIHFLL